MRCFLQNIASRTVSLVIKLKRCFNWCCARLIDVHIKPAMAFNSANSNARDLAFCTEFAAGHVHMDSNMASVHVWCPMFGSRNRLFLCGKRHLIAAKSPLRAQIAQTSQWYMSIQDGRAHPGNLVLRCSVKYSWSYGHLMAEDGNALHLAYIGGGNWQL
jgi:hypothetical protein